MAVLTLLASELVRNTAESPPESGSRVAWHPSQIGDSFGDQETDRIYVVHDSVNSVTGEGGDPVFPPPPLMLRPGETAEYLSPFVRAVGGEITLDRRRHTTKVQVFAGARAKAMQPCDALLDTGSPASFIQERCVERMLACGCASVDGFDGVSKTWGGFHGVPLVTKRRVRLNIQMWQGGKAAPTNFGSPTVRTSVFAHVVPNETMGHSILMGRDSWAQFPVRQFVDVSEKETVVTFMGREAGGLAGDHRFDE